ncbi:MULTISPECIES: hypothetical protein [Micromonospora]|uniref:Uncharacterized protein n=2 Tax=Micromonospora TaxID=1873 RepID=A0A9X0HZY5_9ACTN|nr:MULTISPECIES: hypothetical protein [Micromonospora]AEB44812.1 hypothetical protein VAB18032_18550 [Micromonospora maris AB-18-032]AIS85882.1 hypothetical protein VASRM7_640 [Verrucosispora sp. MS100047]KUJ44286.1 hypothetical protein ADL17_13780 [Micromonospora maris]RUL92128.1 hypothetical protein EG812_15760 [Verrucosispora sp. FIM060022]
MSRIARTVLVVVGAVLGLSLLAPSSAAAADEYTLQVHTSGAAFLYTLCLKTDTTMKEPRGSDRVCTGKRGSTHGTFDMSAPYAPGDSVKMDIEMHTGLAGESVTKDNVDITGARSCTLSGAVHAGKFQCDSPINTINFEPPEITAYTVDTNPNKSVANLLNLMAWLVSAAAVAGLLITGATLAAQLRRGAMEERTEYTRSIAFVFTACLIATTAGPFVRWLALTD